MATALKPSKRILLLVCLILFLFSLTACGTMDSTPEGKREQTRTARAQEVQQTAEPEGETIYQAELTNNIVLMGIILVLIVVGGTLSVIWRKSP